MKSKILNTLLLLLSLSVSLAGGEMLLRIQWRNTGDSVLDYGDVTESVLHEGGMLKPNFRDKVTDGLGREVLWGNNSQGFRGNKEYSLISPPGVKRILSLGDSFAAGYRVGQNETYSFLMEERLNKKQPTEILLAMIEHPGIGLKYLMDFGYKYKADSVWLGLTLGNDLAQVYADSVKKSFGDELRKVEIPSTCLRHGLISDLGWSGRYLFFHSRLMAMAGLSNKRAIVSGYGETYSPKAFDFVHGLGFFMRNPIPEVEEAYHAVFEILSKHKEFSESHNFQLLIFLFPQVFQVQPQDWRLAVSEYALDESCFDLNLPNKRLMSFCEQLGLKCVDPTSRMRTAHQQSGTDYYLPLGDMHWNAKGHAAFVDAIWGVLSLSG